MKEVLVVGAVHLVEHSRGGVFNRTDLLEVDLPHNLLETLQIPDTGLVGVELPRGVNLDINKTEDSEEIDYLFERSRLFKGEQLFVKSQELFEANGHEVVGLDSPELDQRKLAIGLEIERLVRKQHRYEHHERVYYPLGHKDKKRLGTLQAEMAYIDTSLREDAMFDNIAELEPDTIIVGGAHADRLVADANLQKRLGITVSEHYRIHPTSYWGSIADSEVISTDHDELMASNTRLDLEREIAKRRHLAYTIGRLTTDSANEPDFIGTWSDYSVPPVADGLFEFRMTSQERESFTALVRDGLGDAHVVGRMQDGIIQFTKTYVPELSTSEASTRAVYYTGQRQPDGAVHGFFSFGPGDNFRQPFAMRHLVNDSSRLLRRDIKTIIAGKER